MFKVNNMISPLAASSSVWGCYSDCGLNVGEARVEYEGAEDEERGWNSKWSVWCLRPVCDCVFLFPCSGVGAFMRCLLYACLFVYFYKEHSIEETLVCVIGNLIKITRSQIYNHTHTKTCSVCVGATETGFLWWLERRLRVTCSASQTSTLCHLSLKFPRQRTFYSNCYKINACCFWEHRALKRCNFNITEVQETQYSWYVYSVFWGAGMLFLVIIFD